MKASLLLLLILSPHFYNAQNINHELSITPISIYMGSRGRYGNIFYAHGLKYKMAYKKNAISLGSHGTLFNNLDGRKRRRNPNDRAHIPFLNFSSVSYSRRIVDFDKYPEKLNQLYLTGGYHFFQFGAHIGDYWHVDSIDNGGVQVLSGFRTHSLSIGVSWLNTKTIPSKNKNALKAKNRFTYDYIHGLVINLTGYNRFDSYSENTEIPNIYNFKRNGLRFTFLHKRDLSKHLGIFAEFEFLYVPFIDYFPNREIFVPRGGERIKPWFLGIKTGVNLF